MTPERFQKVDRIFQAAMELSPEDRSAFLDGACAGDESLRKEVEGLVASDEHGLSFIEDPAFEVAANLLVHTKPELVEGFQLGQYTILQLIGRGGMGEVYLAEDTELGRKIAVKLLPAEYTKDQDRLQRFRQEARAASALNHPNILTIHQIAQFEGRHFMATEFVDGETLRQRMKQGQLTFDEGLEIASQVGSALAAAHEAGIVHRDIKPENIMLRRDGYIKVLDFGLAKLTEPTSAIRAKAGTVDSDPGLVMGTAKYMSPEQARALEVDGRSDVFSFGIVLYEMLTGSAPFQGDTTSDLLAALLKEEPAPLVDYLSNIPDGLQPLLSKCLSKNKEQRYQTIEEVLADLKALRSENFGGIEILKQSGGGSAVTSSANKATSTLSLEYIVSEIRRHKTGAVFILASVIIVGLGSSFGLRRAIRNFRNSAAEMSLTRVSNTEKTISAAVSPDGKFIAQTIAEKGRANLWLLDVATNNMVELVEGGGGDLTFSRDGNRLYYNSANSLFEVSVEGGAPRKILSEVSGPVGLSPNGDRFAFVRELSTDETILLVVNVDGSGEQELTRRKAPEFISGGPAWSPDGGLIAYGFGINASNKQAGLAVFDLSTRQSRELGNHRWESMERLAWLSDGSGLVMPASDDANTTPLWLVSFPSGEARTVTKDLNRYGDSTLTVGDQSITAIQYQDRNALWIVPAGNPTAARPLNAGKHEFFRAIAVMPDGSILYPSNASGRRDIWVIDAEGMNPRQLTSNAGNNQLPNVSPDGRYIFFSSNRNNTSGFNLWRMNADGGNPIQLTHKGAVEGNATPDGKWVFFAMGGPDVSRDAKTIWKVSIDGGDPVQITNSPSTGPSISSDGRAFACWYKRDKSSPWSIAIIPIDGGPPIKVFKSDRNTRCRPQWTPDGQGLSYVYTVDGVSNIWIQPINGEPAKQYTQFTSDEIESFAWARNGDLICPRGSVVQDVVRISNFR